MRMSLRFLSYALATALLGVATLPDTAEANPQLKARIAATKAEIKDTKKIIRDDKKDLKRIEKIAERWLSADGNDRKMEKADEALLEWLQEELAENREARARARAALESTGASVAPPAPPTGRRAKVRPSAGTSNETPAQRSARQSFEAERDDARAIQDIAESLREVQRRYAAGTAGPQVKAEKAELLRELVRLARRDLRRSERELADDEARLERQKARR